MPPLRGQLRSVLFAILSLCVVTSLSTKTVSEHGGITMANPRRATSFERHSRLEDRSRLADHGAAIGRRFQMTERLSAPLSLSRRIGNQSSLHPRTDKQGGSSRHEKGSISWGTEEFRHAINMMEELNDALETAQVNEHGVTLKGHDPDRKYQGWIDEVIRSPDQRALKNDYYHYMFLRRFLQGMVQKNRQAGKRQLATLLDRVDKRLMHEADRTQTLGKKLIQQWKAARGKTVSESDTIKKEGKKGSSKGKKGSGLKQGFLWY